MNESPIKYDIGFAVLFIALFATYHGVDNMITEEFEQAVGSKGSESFNEIFCPVSEFDQGQQDCKEGKPAASNNEEYLSGYSFQYQVEQVQGHRGFN